MRILIPVLGMGKAGGYRVLSKLADGLIADGHNVTFVVNRFMARPYFPTAAAIHAIDLMGRPASPVAHVPAYFNGFMNMWAIYRAIRRLSPSYDLVLANHSLTVMPAILGAGVKGKVIYYIQAYEPEYYQALSGLKNRVYEWMSRQSYRAGIKKIVNAPIYLSHKEIDGDACVPPGFDPSCFYSVRNGDDSGPVEKIVLGCIGRHEPHKGTRFVLEAFEQLYQRDNRYWLRVAYGNLPPDWAHPNTEIVIPAGDEELGDFYRSLDIYIAAGTVQPGAYHYPVMEALACGTPVIHTGYLPGSEENSWIVPQGRSDLICAEVLRIDWREARTKAVCGIEDVKGYSWPNISTSFNRHLIHLRGLE